MPTYNFFCHPMYMLPSPPLFPSLHFFMTRNSKQTTTIFLLANERLCQPPVT